ITVDNISTPTTSKDNGTTSKTETKTKLGDINDDGAIDSKDAVLVLKYYAESLTGNTTTSIPLEKGDVNGDGKIDSKDAVKILKYYAQTMVGLNVDIKDV
ncbi:MAG: dockerin type I domain-containing protein, partial [Oscillospiraceae bacterium]|nr:dockerin type I domain-containing protein [Oscillospiraceae bacterium]